MSDAGWDELGPVDVVVIGYPAGAPMTGEAVPHLLDLVERGIVRVLDALLVAREPDGTLSGMRVEGMDRERFGDLVVFEGAASGMLDDDDVSEVAELLEPGEAAAIIVYENTWAAGFSAAVRRSGGRLVSSTRIGVQDMIDALGDE